MRSSIGRTCEVREACFVCALSEARRSVSVVDESRAAGGSAKPSDFEDPNDFFLDMYAKAVDRIEEEGLGRERAALTALEVLTCSIDIFAAKHATSLEKHGQRYVDDSAVYREEFAKRLRAYWGASLDLHEKITSAVEEGGRIFAKRTLGRSGERDQLLRVLVHLNGQAVRASREVHALLAAGFPFGAHAISRTVHEISVRAGVLAKFGKEEPHLDFAERFVLHDKVVNYKDALTYQDNAERLRHEPFSEETMEHLKKERDDVIERFGPAFGSPYGWAAGLPGLPAPKRPTFEHLEKLADLDHFRSIYNWSSHYVHADAKAMRISLVERGGNHSVLTDATNAQLADPGQNTLISLYRVFVSMVTSAHPFAFYDILLCKSLQALLDKACDIYVGAEFAVADAEERFQAELAERGMRFDGALGEVPLDDGDLPAK